MRYINPRYLLFTYLLPVHVRHVENAQTWSPTLLYTHFLRMTFRTITFQFSLRVL